MTRTRASTRTHARAHAHTRRENQTTNSLPNHHPHTQLQTPQPDIAKGNHRGPEQQPHTTVSQLNPTANATPARGARPRARAPSPLTLTMTPLSISESTKDPFLEYNHPRSNTTTTEPLTSSNPALYYPAMTLGYNYRTSPLPASLPPGPAYNNSQLDNHRATTCNAPNPTAQPQLPSIRKQRTHSSYNHEAY